MLRPRKSHRLVSTLSVAAALALGLAAPAGASVVVKMELAELTAEADLIAHGTVLSQTSAWEGRRIVTRATLRVDGALKGSAPKTVMLRSLGGVVDGIAQMVHGEPHYAPGEEVVVFLRGLGGGLYRAIGMAQGKFRLITEGGQTHAVQELSGLAIARRAAEQPLRVAHERGHALSATELFAQINALLAAGRSGTPGR